MRTERQKQLEADADRLIASLKTLRPAPAKRAPTRTLAKSKPARKPARARAP
jgi:hypothetical protein